MEKRALRKTFQYILIGMFLILIYIGLIMNASTMASFSVELYSFEGIKEAIGAFESEFLDHFFEKEQFVNLNGLVARVTGMHELNEVYRLDNDVLISIDQGLDMKDVESAIDAVVGMKEFLSDRDIPLLFVLPPTKYDGKEINPPIEKATVIDNSEFFVKALNEEGIPCINLFDYLCESEEGFYSMYFNTDHHWKPVTAFNAVTLTMDWFESEQGLTTNKNYEDIDLWKVERVQNCFLGSRGRRTGRYFAGLDDFELVYPRFDTELSFLVPAKQIVRKGNYYETIFDFSKMESDDVFLRNVYSTYLGADYGNCFLRNQNAPILKKVLVIKDSFALPYCAFLATHFAAIDMIDLRYYTERSLYEYVEATMPDYVIYCMNSKSIAQKEFFSDYHGDRKLTSESKKVAVSVNKSCDIKAKDFAYNYERIGCIEGNSEYLLHIDTMSQNSNGTGYVGVTVYDSEQRKTIDQKILTIGCDQEWRFKTAETDKSLELLIYTGIPGRTENTSLKCSGIELSKLMS